MRYRIKRLDGTLYRLYDAQGTLLYLGQSLNAARRLSDHKRGKQWWKDVVTIKLQRCYLDEMSALEEAAIKAEHPIYNVLHNKPPKPKVEPKPKSPRTVRPVVFSDMPLEGSKVCKHCQIDKPLMDYRQGRDTRYVRGFYVHTICRPCESKARVERRRKRKEEQRQAQTDTTH